MTIEARLVWPTGALLGEGPVWSVETATLHYVDIKGGTLHRYHPGSGRHESVAVNGRPSFILPSEEGSMVAGSEDGLYLVHEKGFGNRIATIPMPDHNRTNDGTVDCHGRLWFGTMDDEEKKATGAIYCLEKGELRRAGGEAVVTNGPAVTADGRTLYHVNSPDRTIWRHHVDASGELRDMELFLRLREGDGYPDGIVLDGEQCLWVALWGGWGVQRYSPAGDLLLQVELPCALVTKIAFGGHDLKTVYVTTARVGLSETEMTRQPLAGGLFAFDAPVAGLSVPKVRLAQ